MKKDKCGNDKTTKISYKIKFIDSCRFISILLLNLVSNLSDNDRCINCKSYPDYMTTKDEKIVFRCFRCKTNYKKRM